MQTYRITQVQSDASLVNAVEIVLQTYRITQVQSTVIFVQSFFGVLQIYRITQVQSQSDAYKPTKIHLEI